MAIPYITCGQSLIKVVDHATAKPVENVQVSVIAIADNVVKAIAVTNDKGIVDVNINAPFIIRTNHVAYIDKTDTVTQSQKTIHLRTMEYGLNELVVTGQFVPTLSEKSLFKVNTIHQERIEKQGASNLEEILSKELNINFSRDNATGSSGLSLQGISGQNVKVLVDGVPMTGRSGVSNEIDINQINLNGIERIEIVEGPMAVNYGADALAGVVNIITRKSQKSKVAAELNLHSESVGDQFSFFEDGIHNPSLIVGVQAAESLMLQAEGRINYFGGWIGSGSDRNRQWYPKTQYFVSGLARYNKGNFNMHYRLDFLNEILENLGEINDNNPLKDPTATDENYVTHRWMHQLQGNYSIKAWKGDFALSYSDYQRLTRQFQTNIVTSKKNNSSVKDEVLFNNYFLRNTIASPLKGWGQIQLGLEANVELASGTKLNEGEKSATKVGLFASGEFNAGHWKIRPGLRYEYNSIYSSIPTPSLHIKYQINPNFHFRIGYGRGFRAPSLRELYHEFIDTNHNILGNPDLQPEYSHSFNADLAYEFLSINFTPSISGFYNHIDNQITFITPIENNPENVTTYINALKFKTTGINLKNHWRNKNFQINAGLSYIGRYQRLSEETNEVEPFVFSWEVNWISTYTFNKINLDFSAFYKYTGPVSEYRLVNRDGDSVPKMQQIDGFHWMDLTLAKRWPMLTATAGVKNLLDLQSINNSFSTGGAHADASGSTSISYGRSYFVKLTFKLKSKR